MTSVIARAIRPLVAARAMHHADGLISSVDVPVDSPVVTPVDVPVDVPVDSPVVTPVGVPVVTPVDVPVAPVNSAIVTSENTTSDNVCSKTSTEILTSDVIDDVIHSTIYHGYTYDKDQQTTVYITSALMDNLKIRDHNVHILRIIQISIMALLFNDVIWLSDAQQLCSKYIIYAERHSSNCDRCTLDGYIKLMKRLLNCTTRRATLYLYANSLQLILTRELNRCNLLDTLSSTLLNTDSNTSLNINSKIVRKLQKFIRRNEGRFVPVVYHVDDTIKYFWDNTFSESGEFLIKNHKK